MSVLKWIGENKIPYKPITRCSGETLYFKDWINVYLINIQNKDTSADSYIWNKEKLVEMSK